MPVPSILFEPFMHSFCSFCLGICTLFQNSHFTLGKPLQNFHAILHHLIIMYVNKICRWLTMFSDKYGLF